MGERRTDGAAEAERLARLLDPLSAVPLSVQLRGALEFGIASGEWDAGARLPSVRALARRLGMSPVTVSAVYGALRAAGHVEGRAGSGTFVRRDGPPPDAARLRAVDRRVGDLLRAGREAGLGPAELALRVSMAPGAPLRALRVLMVGNFPDATAGYAASLQASLPAGDAVEAATLDRLPGGAAPDAVVAARTLVPELRARFAGAPVLGVTLIPDEATRVALAALAPDAAVVGYSFVPAFAATMRAGLARFAPHLAGVAVVVRGQRDAAAVLGRAEVVVFGSGGEGVRAGLRPGQRAFEYRHAPDGRSLRDEVLPALERRRAELADTREAAA